MKLSTFLFINFVVSFLSDIVLNDIANGVKPIPLKSKIIDSLKPYFANKSIIISGIYAGITIAISVLLVSKINNYLFGQSEVPDNFTSLFYFCILAFFIGFIIDILIDKLNIFGSSLKPYYKEAGAGLWGAIAFLFSIIISYFIQKYLVPIL